MAATPSSPASSTRPTIPLGIVSYELRPCLSQAGGPTSCMEIAAASTIGCSDMDGLVTMRISRLRSWPASKLRVVRQKKRSCATDGSKVCEKSAVVTFHSSCGFNDEVKNVLLSMEANQFFFANDERIIDGPGALDLFSGCCGVALKALVTLGCPLAGHLRLCSWPWTRPFG